MSSVDDLTWLSDELWAQVAPPPARFGKTISAAIVLAVVGAVVLSQIGFFHSRIGASYDEASVQGNRLTVVLSLYNAGELPVHVTGLRAAQPGARIVSTRHDRVFPPTLDNAAPDGTRVTAFTVHSDHLDTVTIVYVLDCAKLRLPLRVDIATHNFFGNHTSTATLYSSNGGPLNQVCAVH